ncbi:MAG: precorrin-4 C(11)-methyltransferase [Verrucomicrobiota bacterium]
MQAGIVTFAGAGPGAVDLLTLRCRDAIAEADTIVYAGSLVNPKTLDFASDSVDVHDSAGMNLEQTTQVLADAARAGKKVLRLHTGDPAVYGAIAEQIEELRKREIEFEIIPGVSSVFAAAAAAGCELTLPGVSQTVILSRRAGRTPVPEGEELTSLARHGATLALYLSVSAMPELVGELKTGGYGGDTPVAVVYRASWPEEKLVQGTLDTIAAKIEQADIRRQAIVLVGRALSGKGEASKLYDATFSHGYRQATAEPSSQARAESITGSQLAAPSPHFGGRVAVFALTQVGCALAGKLSAAMSADLFVSEKHEQAVPAAVEATAFDPVRLGDVLATHWTAYDAHILIMASGIAVRKIAPLLRDKAQDPAVVVCSETGEFAISLVGGHIGGGNRLARQIGALLGMQPVVTTATDAQGIPAFDEVAASQGWQILNPPAIKHVNAALLRNDPIGFLGPDTILQAYYCHRPSVRRLDPGAPTDNDCMAVVAVDPPEEFSSPEVPVLRVRPLPLVVGIGCRRGVGQGEIAAAVDAALSDNHLDSRRILKIASVDAKQDEEGLLSFARERDWPLEFFPAERLAEIPVPTPSPAPEQAVGTRSVAEAAALAAGGGKLLVTKQTHGKVTVAVAAVAAAPQTDEPGCIAAVGIGPGTREGLTGEAVDALQQAEVIIGYTAYCEQIKPLFPEKRYISSGMRREVERCREAIAEASRGRSAAIISSGDAGVYGMAGLVIELLADADHPPLEVTVVAGVTAALSASAALGAPLMNDFACISLSDLLSDRDMIIQRLHHVAAAGMPCALYNPRSRKRKELFDEAVRIFTDTYGPDHPCGLVNNAGRVAQDSWVGVLAELPVERVTMSTLVIMGGSQTQRVDGRLITRRGYAKRMNQ